MDPYEEADLRRRQAEFGAVTRKIDEQNSLFALPALAPDLVVGVLDAAEAAAALFARPSARPGPLSFPPTRGHTPRASLGQKVHAETDARVNLKPGWEAQRRYNTELGEMRPDISAPARDPQFPDKRYIMELKPNTPSGRQAGARAAKRYAQGTKNKVRVIFYNPEDYE